MKQLILAATIFLSASATGWSEEKDAEPDDSLESLYERALPIYQEEFNRWVEAGKLDPDPVPERWKEGSLPHKLWMAGYYSAVMSYMEPSILKDKARAGGIVEPQGFGVKLSYSFGWWAGINRVDPIARKLHLEILAGLLSEDDKTAGQAQPGLSVAPQPDKEPDSAAGQPSDDRKEPAE
ncbi:hypothetical protein OKA04_15205 [Luteolibacter flavescens]|uniref:Uncharacterized protein n=1 Tax=Luteolibacter flavescens TaxID=1859460 RepID=A0ABT3FR98_9BACT|nr:hypothetical protein [Luteolibacter flavescens]MCW1886085.1 hypothetical protein [Luteolibacter flavescens]